MDACLAGTGIIKPFTFTGAFKGYDKDNGRARSAPTRSPHGRTQHASLTSSRRLSRVAFNLKERRPGPHYGSPLYNGFTAALLPHSPEPEPTPRPHIYPGIVPRPAPNVSEVQSRGGESYNIIHVTGRQDSAGITSDQRSVPLDLLAPARIQLAIQCASSPVSSGPEPLARSSSATILASPTRHNSRPSLLTMFASASLPRPETLSPQKTIPLSSSYTSPQRPTQVPENDRLPAHHQKTFSEPPPPDPLASSTMNFIPHLSNRETPSIAEPTFDSVRQLLSTLKFPHAPGLTLEATTPPPTTFHPLFTSVSRQPLSQEPPLASGVMQIQETKPRAFTPMLPMPAHLTQRTHHPSASTVADEVKGEKVESDGTSKWRREQLQAVSHLIQKGLLSDQSFSVLGIIGATASPLNSEDEAQSLALIPVRLVKLIAVRSVARARQDSLSLGLKDLLVKVKEVKKELDLSNAYEAALKLGVPKSRLGKFRRLGVTGFTVSVLQLLYAKLRLKLFISLLKQRLGQRKDLEALIEQSHLSLSSFFRGIVMQRWQQVAKDKAQGRAKSALFHHQQVSRRVHKGLLMWHVVSKYRQQLRRQVSQGIWTTVTRRTREAFLGWLDCTRRVLWREGILQRLVEERQRHQVKAWRQWASNQVVKAKSAARAESHRRRSLLVASLAHWRILHLRGKVRVLRHEALKSWYRMRLKGRVMKHWHFIARRATAIIAKANARGARQQAILAPPPRSLSSGASAAAEVMSRAASLVQSILDEISHLQQYCTLGLYLAGPKQSNDMEVEEEAEPLSSNGGGRLLIGQWNKKQEVIHLVSHKLAIEEKLMEAEAGLATQADKHERLSFTMSAMLASLRETCEGHKLQLGGLVEESGKLEGEDQEINRNIGVFESIRVPEAEAEAARTSAVAAAASAEASNSAAFESSNGNEAFRSSLFHRTAIERVQARADVLSAAEDEVPKYTSAEQRAREKLLLEQRRLSEALSITSSLSLHLKESQIAKEGAPAYQKPRHRQAVSEAEDALQEARKIQVLQQIEVDHQQAAVNALSLAAEQARARAKEAEGDWKQASADAQVALHAANAMAQRVKSEGSTAYQMTQRAEGARRAAESAASAAGDARVELQRMRSRSAEVHRQLEALAARADEITRSIKEADDTGKVARDRMEASEAELTSAQLSLQPVIYRCNVLLMQIGKELSVHPEHLVRFIENEVKKKREEQRKLHETQGSPSGGNEVSSHALLDSSLPASLSQLLALPPPPPSAPRPSLNPEVDPPDLKDALQLRSWARKHGLMPLYHFGGNLSPTRGRQGNLSPTRGRLGVSSSRPPLEGHDDVLPGDEPWVPPGPNPHHISMIRTRSPSPSRSRSRSRSPSRPSLKPDPPISSVPQPKSHPSLAGSIPPLHEKPRLLPPPFSFTERSTAADTTVNLAELSLANSPDEPPRPSQPQPSSQPQTSSQPLLWEWLGAGPPSLMVEASSLVPKVPKWNGEGGGASSIASSSDTNVPLQQHRRGANNKGNAPGIPQQGVGSALIYPLRSLSKPEVKGRPPFRLSGPNAKSIELKGRAPYYAAVTELPLIAAGGQGEDWGDDEGSESMGLPPSVLRVIMMDRDRRLKGRVVQKLKASVRYSREDNLMAEEQAFAHRLVRSFRVWAEIVRSTAAGSRNLKKGCILHRYIRQWRAWTAQQASYRSLIDGAIRSRCERQSQSILRQWRKLVERRLFCEIVAKGGERKHFLLRSFRYWKGLVEARQLLTRVFLVAEEAWEMRADSALVFGEQFQLLGSVIGRWRDWTLVKREKRQDRAKDESAAVHSKTRVLVGVFRAWVHEVESSWAERFMRRLCTKILNRWHDRTQAKLVKGSSCLVAIRRRLRIRSAFSIVNESGHYQAMLLGRCFWAWASTGPIRSDLHHDSQLQKRAWSAWVESHSQSKAKIFLAIEQGDRNVLRNTMRRWKDSCDQGVRLKKLERLAGIWRSRNLSHLVLIGLRRHVASRRVLMASLQAAMLLRYSALLRRSFRAWRSKGEAAIHQQELSLTRRAWKAWRMRVGIDVEPGRMLRGLQAAPLATSVNDRWTIKSFRPSTRTKPSISGTLEHLHPAISSLIAASKEVVRSVSSISPSGVTVVSLSDL